LEILELASTSAGHFANTGHALWILASFGFVNRAKREIQISAIRDRGQVALTGTESTLMGIIVIIGGNVKLARESYVLCANAVVRLMI
jgi:hypothetical protein